MAEVFYPGKPATDGPDMDPVPGAIFEVFEISDATRSNPLPVRVGDSNPKTTVEVSIPWGTVPDAWVDSPNFEHIWKSGTFEWRRDSIDGAKKAIEDAKLAASNSASASDASAVSAANSAQAAQDAAALVDAPADQIMADTAANPASAFSGELDAKIVGSAKATLHDSYAGKPDGPLTVADSGQTWTKYQNNAAGAALSIINGRLTNTATGTTVAAGYAEEEHDENVNYIGGEFDLSPYTTNNGGAVFAVWKTSGVQINSSPFTVPDSPCHLVITPTGWQYGVFNGGALTLLRSGSFTTPLATDGTLHEVSISLVDDTATFTLPDGSVKEITDSRIRDNAGRFACFEVYQQVASTDSKAAFGAVYADARPVDGDAGLVTVARLMRESRRTVENVRSAHLVKRYAPATSDTIAIPTAEADLKVGETEVAFYAPPSGRVLITLSAWVSMTASARLLWGVRNGTSTLTMESVVTGAFTGNVMSRRDLALTPGGFYTLRWRHFYAGGTGGNLIAHAGSGYSAVMSVQPL